MTTPSAIDELVARAHPTPVPTPEETAFMLDRMSGAITDRGRRSAPRRRRLLLSAAAAVGIVVIAFISVSTNAPPARAKMGQIASILNSVDPVEATDKTYVFIETEQVGLSVLSAADIPLPDFEDELFAFYKPRVRSEWWGNEGTVHWVTIPGEPEFLRPEDREVFEEAGLIGDDLPGVPQTQTFESGREEWATDQAEMDSMIRERIRTNLTMSEDAQYAKISVQVLRDSFDRPTARATALLGMGNLRELRPVEGSGEFHTFEIEYVENGGRVLYTFAVDDEGFLRFEENVLLTDSEWGIPAGTTTFHATYSRPVLVGAIDQRP